MQFPLSWLKEYIDLNMPPAELARILTTIGIEVDAILREPLLFEHVVVGKVQEVHKHPNADKLCMATVNDGKHDYQVVCGAPNCRVGMKTAFAPVGAVLTDKEGKSFKIKQTKIRGVESFGMLCSGQELALSTETDGILDLPKHLAEGMLLADFYADSIFEIAITPNLGHCASIIGIARELSAALALPLRLPDIIVNEQPGESIEKFVKVVVQDPKDCPRYAGRLIKNVKVAPSPNWLKKRIEACGLRSINNVVDITNYVLLETGHPLHAFDRDKLSGGEMIVRSPKEGERLITLDGKERVLDKEQLLICDSLRPIAIAGVMGGLETEVTDQTVNVFLESAYFRPAVVRKTSKQLGIMTDASKHFERGVDPNALLFALNRAAMLIQEIAGGEVVPGSIDLKESDFPQKHLLCRLSRVNGVLGKLFSLSEVELIFHRLGFSPKANSHNEIAVKVPTYRVDITGEIDLIEEVARLHGYDNFSKESVCFQSSKLPHAPIFLFEREMRSRLIAEGLQEFLTCDLIGPSLVSLIEEGAMPEDAMIRVMNPVSIEQSILRFSMLPGLLQLVKYNIDHQNHHISGFEIGKIHFKKDDQYKEQSAAGIILSGKRRPHYWDDKPQDFDFYDLKGMIENVLLELGIGNVRFKENAINTFHSGRQAAIFVGTLAVGSLGEIHPRIQRRLDVPQRIIYAELNLHDLFQVRQVDRKMSPLPLYPCSERDWTITLQEKDSIQQIFDVIHTLSSPLLEEVSLLDIYRSDKLGKEHKNATFHFVYRDKEKTIAQEVVDAEHEGVTKAVLSALGKVVL